MEQLELHIRLKSWEYSTFNDKMLPIPEAKSDENNGVNKSVQAPAVEIDEDEIPF